jgi:diaminohydroxyphosphoribosylaminopyrimidine deaminase / 5-amino-6-(5-phosphoribosylamino)uracil reductase
MRTPPLPSSSVASDEALQRAAWRVLLAAAGIAREVPELNRLNEGRALGLSEASFGLDENGMRVPLSRERASAWLVRDAAAGWVVGPAAPAAARGLLDLYAPLCAVSARRPLTIAHLGQSLDGYIATGSGDSYYVTGPANLAHLHRLRALCDAVVVGAGTVACDDPQLTVRHVEGANPTRVILDPQRRLGANHRVFSDGAKSLLICAEGAAAGREHGAAEVVEVPLRDGTLDLAALLAALHARGLHGLFVEGGGATVSSFLEAGLLDRVQIAIAPLVTGHGRRGLSLPARDKIAECLRPRHRVFTMGGDVLFDCDLRASAEAPTVAPGGHGDLIRVV